MITFLKKYKPIIGTTVGLLDLFAGYLSYQAGNSVEGLLFVSIGTLFILDALE
jgi:hypothetical protein